MARRTAGDEKPFRPLDMSVLRSVVQHTVDPKVAVTAPPMEARVINLSPGRRPESRVITETAAPPAPMPAPVVQRLDQEKRVLYTRDERQSLDRLVHNLAGRLQTPLKASHVLRALTALLLNAEIQVDQRASEHGTLTRPPNGDVAALQRFERDLASLLLHALRDAGPLK